MTISRIEYEVPNVECLSVRQEGFLMTSQIVNQMTEQIKGENDPDIEWEL